ncbi:glycosyltransferase [Escherichia coli]|nr:glycosyltransferase [Escherichia coli]
MISVIMAVHRYDKYVDISIDSILNQTYSDFELIIIANGGDCFEIAKQLKHYTELDNRVKIYTLEIGQLSFALNYAVTKCKYSIIARMDSDDVSLPLRLEKQYMYMLQNDLEMVGTGIRLINENGEFIKELKYPNHNKIDKILPFKNCFAHPTLMFKKDVILKQRGYCGGFNSEDYDLWLRILNECPNIRWDNLSECLLNYRIHNKSTQKSALAYYECASYSLREFLKKRTITNFLSCLYHFCKALIK